jgi:hypothetical protein
MLLRAMLLEASTLLFRCPLPFPAARQSGCVEYHLLVGRAHCSVSPDEIVWPWELGWFRGGVRAEKRSNEAGVRSTARGADVSGLPDP